LAGYEPEQPITGFNALWDLVIKSDKFIVADFLPKLDACKIASGKYKTDLDFVTFTFQQQKVG
jgi:hypothetical protein